MKAKASRRSINVQLRWIWTDFLRAGGTDVSADTNGWMPIETAPRDHSEFLAFGSYLYPGDRGATTYCEVASYSGDLQWPWTDAEGMHRPEFFTHWQPLPKPPVVSTSTHEGETK